MARTVTASGSDRPSMPLYSGIEIEYENPDSFFESPKPDKMILKFI
jgi:hypothetical protein